MLFLVADVGGTNTRLALADEQGLRQTSIVRFSNARHHSFYGLVEGFLDQCGNPKLAACCVAMAGPVTAGQARLTNLDWHISIAKLKQITGVETALLMNDLTALGYSLPQLPEVGLARILRAKTDIYRNGQSLVVGIGTGFNVCPVKAEPHRPLTCLATELGHVSLPQSLVVDLEEHLPGHGHSFDSVEDCFSGYGLSKIFGLMTGEKSVGGKEIIARHQTGNDLLATETLELFARLLGGLSKEMALQYLPLNGIFFAGSVARGLFQANMAPSFLAAFANHQQFQDQLSNMPVSLILDDGAALIGCVNACTAL
jgi:glucokinase